MFQLFLTVPRNPFKLRGLIQSVSFFVPTILEHVRKMNLFKYLTPSHYTFILKTPL